MKKIIKSLVRTAGYDLVPAIPAGEEELRLSDLSPREREIIQQVRPFTMTSVERLAALVNAVTHLVKTGVSGDFAECGVWRGGSTMAAALTLVALGQTDREIFLYDTFEGMTAPSEKDVSYDGRAAEAQLNGQPRDAPIWCYATVEEVRENLRSTGYPEERIHLVKGPVEKTIPGTLPGSLALLRLDTDWYESTRHELTHLYPRLNPGGVLIIDDYGHWQGARKAVDEYFQARGRMPYLHRIDNTGRILVLESTMPASAAVTVNPN